MQGVEECTLIHTNHDVAETDDQVYKYARVLRHYGALVLKFGDGCVEGDRKCVKKGQFRSIKTSVPG